MCFCSTKKNSPLVEWFGPCVTAADVVLEWGKGAALWRSIMFGCAFVLTAS